MIVSDFQLNTARHAFVNMFQGRLADFENEEPAEIRVLVRLSGVDDLPDMGIVGALHVLQRGMNPPMSLTEIERYSVTSSNTLEFNRFKYSFVVGKRYELCVKFYLNSYVDGIPTKELIGSATVELQDLIESENERKEVQLLSLEGDRAMHTKAVFALEYANMIDAMFCLVVRIKVAKREGWPFETTLPFFVLFRWDPESIQGWTALYRSEVLDRPTDHPDAQGSMVYQEIQINLKEANAGIDDDRPLRIEFFQYKPYNDGLLLGYFMTTLRHLRQQRPGRKLQLEVNTYPQGELIGELRMKESQVTMKRHYFSLQAEFGGVVKGDFVYVDIALTEEKRHPGWSGLSTDRPFYKIVRIGYLGKWEDVYRSEVQSQVRSKSKRGYRFVVAKLSERKLTRGHNRSSFCFLFCYEKLGGKEVKVGYFETTVEELTEAKPGHVFALRSASGAEVGYVRLEQADRGESFTYFAANCVLKRPPSLPNDTATVATDETASLSAT